jgi:hypothetical protein
MPERLPVTDAADLTGAELLDAYRRRTLSPGEAMAAVFDRVERGEPRL